MIQVNVQENRMGHLTLAIVNKRLLKRVMAHVKRNGGPAEETVYLQADTDINTFKEGLTKSKRQDLEEGYDIIIVMDEYEAGSYYGYDASTVFTGKAQA